MELDSVYMAFLDIYPKRTKFTYSGNIKLWFEFIGMNGQEIIDKKKEDKEFFFEKKILEFKNWLLNRGFSENTVKTAIGTVRAFFSYHRVPLNLTRQEGKRLSKAKRVTNDYALQLEDIQKMAMIGSLKEKLVLLLGKSLGLRASDFNSLTFGVLRAINLDSESPIPLMPNGLVTIKEGVLAFPFIDNDALEVVRLWLETNRDKPNHARILDVKPEELTVILRNLTRRANIQTGDQIVRFHCLRKFLCDKLSNVMSESKWKQIVGKQISEGAYISSDLLKEDYKKVLQYTLINKLSNGKISTIQETVDLMLQALRPMFENALIEAMDRRDKAVGGRAKYGGRKMTYKHTFPKSNTEFLRYYIKELKRVNKEFSKAWL